MVFEFTESFLVTFALYSGGHVCVVINNQVKNGVKSAGRAAEISDLNWFPPPGRAAGATTAQGCYSRAKRLQFPSCSAIYSAAQSTANHAPKITPRPKTPPQPLKEAAGCGRPSCSELNWQFRARGPCWVGLDVSITFPPVWLTVIFCGVCNTISSPSNQCRNGHLSPGVSSRYTKSEL